MLYDLNFTTRDSWFCSFLVNSDPLSKYPW